jgi:hypothetical protein
LNDLSSSGDDSNFRSSSDNDGEDDDDDNDGDDDDDEINYRGEEVWNEVLPENIAKDLETAPPLPEAITKHRKMQRVNSLIFWLVYFLLVWQAYLPHQ